MTPSKKEFTLLLCLSAALLPSPTIAAFSTPEDSLTIRQQELVEKIAADCQKGSIDLKERIPVNENCGIPSIEDTDIIYQGCMSAVSPQSCDLFAGKTPESIYASRQCLQLKEFMALSWATIKQNDNSACARSHFFDGDGDDTAAHPQKEIAARCELLVPSLKSGKVDTLIEQVVEKKLVQKSQIQKFSTSVTDLRGQPDLCNNLPAKDQARCRVQATLLKSLRSGNCAESPLCQALASQKAEACAPYLTAVEANNKAFCARIATISTRANLRKKEAYMRQRLQELKELKAERIKQDEALQKAKALPPAQFQPGQRMQAVPAAVQKRLEEIERKSKAAKKSKAPQPTGTELSSPKTTTP